MKRHGEMSQEKLSDWYSVNDSVMGGVSESRATVSHQKTLLFSGEVSFENNGGFASIRRDSQPFELARGDGIGLRVKGDGKTYQLRLRTSNGLDGVAYKVGFATIDGEWMEFYFPWETFEATWRGRFIPGAPKLEAANIRQIGLMISDKQEGSFSLEVQVIDSFQSE